MGGKADAPDYGALAAASQDSARIMAGLGQRQLEEGRRQYDLAFPFISQIAQGQADIMRQNADQGKDYFNYMRNTFRPLEEKMVADASAFNTEAKREELARQAAADTGLAFEQQQGMMNRAMAAQGVNPNSPAAMAMRQKAQLGLAANRANAMNNTRQQAEALGYARMADAVGMGRNLPNASSGAYQVAIGAGNSAGNLYQQPGQNYLNAMNQGANIIGSGRQMYQDGLGNALNGQASIYNNQSSPWATIAGLGMAYMSSKKLKERTSGVDAQAVSKAVEQLPVDRWRYKPGVQDGGAVEHIGPYAEDMDKLGAGAAHGRAIDVISAMGLTLAAAKGLGQRVAKLEQQQQAPAARRA